MTLRTPRLLTKNAQTSLQDRLQHKLVESLPAVVPSASTALGEVEALIAVTGNVDDGGDILAPGGFVLDRWPVVLWNHSWDHPAAKVLDIAELLPGDPRLPVDLLGKGLGALWARVLFDLDDPQSESYYRKVRFHERMGWSIGWLPLSEPKMVGETRVVEQWTILEGSPTPQGMNREARTLAVKTSVDTRPPADVADAALDLARGDDDTEGEDALEPVATRDELTLDELDKVLALDDLPDEVRAWAEQTKAQLDTEAEEKSEDDAAVLDDGYVEQASGTDEVIAEGLTELAVDEKSAQLVMLLKRGRVLSRSNEAALRDALTAIQDVLAKVTDDDASDDEADDEKSVEDLVETPEVEVETTSVEVDAAAVLEDMRLLTEYARLR